MAGYTVSDYDPDVSSRALMIEEDISPKHAVEICRAIRGMMVEDALDFLDDVIDLKTPVPFRRYNKRVAHQKGVGPGRFPEKAARTIKKAIESAKNNAEFDGKDASNMYISTISASRGRVTEGYIPRAHGRSTQFNHETVNIEVVLTLMEEEE
jgi:large subunit ribosomal protein L22